MNDKKISDYPGGEEYLNDSQRVKEREEAKKAFKEWNALNDKQKRRKIQHSLDNERKPEEDRLIQRDLSFPTVEEKKSFVPGEGFEPT